MGAAGGSPSITLPTLFLQLRGAAGGLSGVHEWLQPGMLEGHGAEGLLPWLLGVPVLRYGRRGPLPCSSHPSPGLSICSVRLHSPSPCSFTEHLLRANTACPLVLAAWGWAESGAAQRCWGQGRIKNSWSTTEFWGGPQSALGGQRPHATAMGPAWMA